MPNQNMNQEVTVEEEQSWPNPAMVRRVSFWGATIVGFFAIIAAVNAVYDGEYIGAGVLLLASAFSFASIQRLNRRRGRISKHDEQS